LFETIRIEDGKPLHLYWHEERMKRSMQGLPGIVLEREIHVPDEFRTGTVRCKVVYDKEIIRISFSNYERRPVRSLRMISSDAMDYHLKFYDRAELEALFEKRGDCDDIIIVRGGLITDSCIANLIFFDGLQWFTPSHPLLEGTCRARLIAEGKLLARDIRVDDLPHLLGCKLINAMRAPEEQEMIPLNKVFS